MSVQKCPFAAWVCATDCCSPSGAAVRANQIENYWHAVAAPVHRKLGETYYFNFFFFFKLSHEYNVVKYNTSNKTYLSKNKIADFKNYLKSTITQKTT